MPTISPSSRSFTQAPASRLSTAPSVRLQTFTPSQAASTVRQADSFSTARVGTTRGPGFSVVDYGNRPALRLPSQPPAYAITGPYAQAVQKAITPNRLTGETPLRNDPAVRQQLTQGLGNTLLNLPVGQDGLIQGASRLLTGQRLDPNQTVRQAGGTIGGRVARQNLPLAIAGGVLANQFTPLSGSFGDAKKLGFHGSVRIPQGALPFNPGRISYNAGYNGQLSAYTNPGRGVQGNVRFGVTAAGTGLNLSAAGANIRRTETPTNALNHDVRNGGLAASWSRQNGYSISADSSRVRTATFRDAQATSSRSSALNVGFNGATGLSAQLNRAQSGGFRIMGGEGQPDARNDTWARTQQFGFTRATGLTGTLTSQQQSVRNTQLGPIAFGSDRNSSSSVSFQLGGGRVAVNGELNRGTSSNWRVGGSNGSTTSTLKATGRVGTDGVGASVSLGRTSQVQLAGRNGVTNTWQSGRSASGSVDSTFGQPLSYSLSGELSRSFQRTTANGQVLRSSNLGAAFSANNASGATFSVSGAHQRGNFSVSGSASLNSRTGVSAQGSVGASNLFGVQGLNASFGGRVTNGALTNLGPQLSYTVGQPTSNTYINLNAGYNIPTGAFTGSATVNLRW